ncbi:response regulator transcription factor [Pectinatus haikarae]|uniref:response regulator transcription factor n=1 Tax=Pectinatus haikarae TaxID=349096 RepID=UPI0018C67153|nr:response regulator [Pectinatus haikarae]
MYRVLLVDDDSAERYILRRFDWKSSGFCVAGEASDGKEALQFLTHKEVELIITDIRMPGMDGLSFLQELRQKKINSCVILLSTYSNFEYAQQGIRLGVFDYMTKPPADNELRLLLQRVCSYLTSEKYLQREIAAKYEINTEGIAAKICRFVLDHIEDSITLESLAQEFSISRDYAGKYFKQKLGENFNEYLTKMKMEHAKYLLRSGKYKNYEISERLGYASPDYFCRLFKLYAKMTPGEYKKNIDNKK